MYTVFSIHLRSDGEVVYVTGKEWRDPYPGQPLL
jgi:hypothetical protein